jgi:purine-nucleoside phosphorylase
MHDLTDSHTNLFEVLAAARDAVQQRSGITPRIGMILGSGLDALAADLTDAVSIPYRDIPGFVAPSIPGHRGELVLGWLAGQPVAVLRGRLHFYEGYSMQQITFPVRVLHALNCTTLIVTNAAGGLHATWRPGDIMCLSDQLFLPGMAGHHPLRGPHDERLGPRFPAMIGAFDAELRELAAATAAAQGLTLHQGVYAMVSGPSFESGAELRALRLLGADAVGMSTAPEVVVARQVGMRVLGLSLITNLALPEGAPATHSEVLEVGTAARPAFAALLRSVVQQHL